MIGVMSDATDRSGVPTRVFRRGEPVPHDDYRSFSVEERLAMMWPLALEAWEFMGDPVREPRLPRHVVRVVRGRR